MWSIQSEQLLGKFDNFSIIERQYFRSSSEEKHSFQYVQKNDSVLSLVCRKNKIGLLKVDRFLIGESLELVGGRIKNNGELPLDAAKREIYEEIGIKNADLKFIYKTYPLPNITNEAVYLYMCDLDKNAEITLSPEEGILDFHFYSHSEIISLIKEHKIKSTTDLSLLIFFLFLSK